MIIYHWKNISEEKINRRLSSIYAKKRLPDINGIKKAQVIIPAHKEVALPAITTLPAGINILEIAQKPFSHLNFSYIQNGTSQKNSILIIRNSLEEGAACFAFAAILGGASSNLILETSLDGSGSLLREQTFCFGNRTQQFSIHSNTVINAKNCSAKIELKGILSDFAKANCNVKITATHEAKGSDAEVTENILLLSPDAYANAIPGLQIETNDIDAKHSAAITRVDENQLFYAMSRGIGKRKAVKLIAEGFLAGIYENCLVKKQIISLIQKKLCRI